jgi:hypothetical protein
VGDTTARLRGLVESLGESKDTVRILFHTNKLSLESMESCGVAGESLVLLMLGDETKSSSKR